MSVFFHKHLPLFSFAVARSTTPMYFCILVKSSNCSKICVFLHHLFFVRSVLHFIYIFMTKITTKIPTKLPIFEIFSMYVLLLCVVFFKLLVFSFQCVHKMLFTLCKRFDSINALFFLPFRIIPIRRSARCSFFFICSMHVLFIYRY